MLGFLVKHLFHTNNLLCIQEEMTRLQQTIEELKMESGDEGDDKKVSIPFTIAPSVLIYVSQD